MKHVIDLATWPRREHFAFFSAFDEVDVTQARAEAQRLGVSFFLYYLYHAMHAANEVEAFRYRIEGDQVVCYDRVHASATLGRPDHTFAFSFIESQDNLEDFLAAANAEIAAVQQSSGLRLSDTTHARSFQYPDSAPKISFGQVYTDGDTQRMAVSVNLHHGLGDGYHVGLFLAAFQRRLG
jgi:chloramphenicol O-acetyltransferase type A